MFFVLPGLLLILEVGYFVWVLAGDRDLEKSDLIVVFEGGYGRAQTAYTLVDQAYAPNLLVSPATANKLTLYEKKFLPSLPYDRVMEVKSRTTLENAVHTRAILGENGFRSAILVTSWDHMPRSFFLLRTLTRGSDIRIARHTVATGGITQANWYRHRPGWKMVYNEMVKLWGSLMELAYYKISGKLIDQAPGKSEFAQRLKQLLLFKIDRKSLHESICRLGSADLR